GRPQPLRSTRRSLTHSSWHTVNGELLRDEDRRIYFESGGASGSSGCGDEEEGADHQDDVDEDGDGDT
nr:hypothetical protein [Tanacetum cinerariifolium]